MATIRKTFRLQSETVTSLDELVRAGIAASQTTLIDELVRRERVRLAKRQREERLLVEWTEAMQDPLFVADQWEIEDAFRFADAEVVDDI